MVGAFFASLGGWLSIMVAALAVGAFVSLVMMSDESNLENPVLMYSLMIVFFGSVGVWLIRVGRRMRAVAKSDM